MRLRGIRSEVRRIGLDLDLTLIDTRDAVRSTLRVLNEAFDHQVDVEVVVGRLGPPLRSELAHYLPETDLDDAVRVYREAFLTTGMPHLTPMPGALPLFDAGRRCEDFLAVITARMPSLANPCLDACQLQPDDLVGNVVGAEKAHGLRDLKLEVFIGDHPLDMQAAHAAGVPGIGVTTGHHGSEELLEAGAHIVVDSLAKLIEE